MTSTKKLSSIPRPSQEVLGTMITLVEKEEGSIDSLQELAQMLNKRFNLEVSVDDLTRFYQPKICEIESELIYKQYGY